jgi:hypothetical protein
VASKHLLLLFSLARQDLILEVERYFILPMCVSLSFFSA